MPLLNAWLPHQLLKERASGALLVSLEGNKAMSKRKEENFSGLLLSVGIKVSPNPDSTKKSSLNFNPA